MVKGQGAFDQPSDNYACSNGEVMASSQLPASMLGDFATANLLSLLSSILTGLCNNSVAESEPVVFSSKFSWWWNVFYSFELWLTSSKAVCTEPHVLTTTHISCLRREKSNFDAVSALCHSFRRLHVLPHLIPILDLYKLPRQPHQQIHALRQHLLLSRTHSRAP